MTNKGTFLLTNHLTNRSKYVLIINEQVSAELPKVTLIGGSNFSHGVVGSFGLGLAQIVFSHSYSFFNSESTVGFACKNLRP